MSQPVLEIKGLCQSYGRHQVLKDLSLSLQKGEILGVIGENGAGKSTLVKCILGMLAPSSGTITLRCSAAAIHQELNLAGDLPVCGNFFLGREIVGKFGLLDRATMARRTAEGLARLGADVDPLAETSTLSVSEKQMLEIARAVDIDAGLLILDEPSALLDEDETLRLFAVMRKLKAGGTAMIYISHKLAEIPQICDSVAVLRDGALAGAGPAGSISPREMAEMMVGRSLDNIYPTKNVPSETVAVAFSSPSTGAFSIREGEILGVAGLAGSGSGELGEILAGFRHVPGATLRVRGREVPLSSPRDARRAGIGFLAADRLANGIWRDFTLAENIAHGALDRLSRLCVVSGEAVREAADRYVKAFAIKCQGTEDKAGSLSGGNQQKVSIAKSLADKPSVVVLNEPTQGVDVGARQEIYASIAGLAAKGLAILLISSDLVELIGICHRIVVMREGRIAGEASGDSLDEKTIIRIATGTS